MVTVLAFDSAFSMPLAQVSSKVAMMPELLGGSVSSMSALISDFWW